MINEVAIIYNEYFFQFILFIVTFALAYLISKGINLNNAKSLFALHSIILFIFVFLNLIDYMFIMFAIIEIITLLKMSKEGDNSA